MGDGEAIIHLKKPRDTTVSVWLPQDHLDGLNHLLHFVEALQKHGGQGRVPGYFELVMHYRMLRSAVYKAERTNEPIPGTEQSEDEIHRERYEAKQDD